MKVADILSRHKYTHAQIDRCHSRDSIAWFCGTTLSLYRMTKSLYTTACIATATNCVTDLAYTDLMIFLQVFSVLCHKSQA